MVCTEWKELPIQGNASFKVPAQLELIKRIDSGAYGKTAAFLDKHAGRKLAVTKIQGAFDILEDGNLILNEIKLLQCIRHENIMSIVDMYPPESPDFDDVYLVKEYMETDLHRVIHSKQSLSDEHHKHFSYQLLRGLLYLHSANIVHGDLTPWKLLVNKACDLKISDFRGTLSRAKQDAKSAKVLAKPWYAAPEKILLGPQFLPSEDVWSAGCILCELIGRKPIFEGKEYLDQTRKVLHVLGTPSETDLEWLPFQSPARRFLARFPQSAKSDFASSLPNATKASVDVIEAMLTFSPTKRVTVHDALRLSYYCEHHTPEEEPLADAPIDLANVQLLPSKRLLQNHVYVECCRFQPDIEDRDKDLLPPLGLDDLLRSDRARQPVVLTLRAEAMNNTLDEDSLELTFTNIAGNTQASLTVNSAKDSALCIRNAVEEQIQKPVKLVMPNGDLLSSSQDSTVLADILEASGGISS